MNLSANTFGSHRSQHIRKDNSLSLNDRDVPRALVWKICDYNKKCHFFYFVFSLLTPVYFQTFPRQKKKKYNQKRFSSFLRYLRDGRRGGEGKAFYNLEKKVFFGETGQDDTNDIPLINLLNPALQTGVCVARVTSDISPSLLFRSAPQTCQMLNASPGGSRVTQPSAFWPRSDVHAALHTVRSTAPPAVLCKSRGAIPERSCPACSDNIFLPYPAGETVSVLRAGATIGGSTSVHWAHRSVIPASLSTWGPASPAHVWWWNRWTPSSSVGHIVDTIFKLINELP